MTKKWRTIWILLIAIVLLGTAGYFFFQNNNPRNTTISEQKGSSQQNIKGVSVSHIFLIVMENQPAKLIVGNSHLPYINKLIDSYGLAENYSAVTHPSLPNYLALTSGSTDGVTNDCNPPGSGCVVGVRNIADEIEKSGRTWKTYAESMPSACYLYNSGNYATKHVPFLYYADIFNDRNRCSTHVVSFSNLYQDLSSLKSTPDFAFIVPNLCDDMHSCSAEVGDYWLSQNIPKILSSKAFISEPSLLVITWDEGNESDNQVATIFAGSAAKQHYKSTVSYDHYSLLHTIEYLWQLKPLTPNDSSAKLMNEFIR